MGELYLCSKKHIRICRAVLFSKACAIVIKFLSDFDILNPLI